MGSKVKDKALAKGTARKSQPMPEPGPKSPKPTKLVTKAKSKKAALEKKKKRKRERMDTEPGSDDDDDDDDDDDEAEADGKQERERQDEVEQVSDDEDNVKAKTERSKKGDTRTQAEKDKDERLKSARRNAKSKRRGFRTIAKRSGYSADMRRAGHDGAFDVAVPITTLSEAIRACKWAPKQADKAAFEGLTEFDERVQLSLESLPKSGARVFHKHGEQYLRRLASQTVQLAIDQLKPRATASMVASITRPLRRTQKYSFVSPLGVLRHAQGGAKGMRLDYADGEQAVLDKEKALLKMQVALAKGLVEKAKAEKGASLHAKDGGENAKKAHTVATDRIAEIRKQAQKECLLA